MNKPPISILIAVAPEIATSILAGSDRITGSVYSEIGAMVAALGIPGTPRVELDVGEANARVLALTANGYPCFPSENSLQLAFFAATGKMPQPGTSADSLRAWLEDDADESSVAQFISLWCARVLGAQPSVLLSEPHAAEFGRLLLEESGANGWPPSPIAGPELLRLLRRLVSLWVSICDVPAFASVLTDLGGVEDNDVTFERVLRHLRPPVLEFCCNPELLRRIAVALDGPHDLLPFLREGLYTELGITLPDFEFVADASLPSNSFRFRLNHLVTAPWQALPPGRLLVNDTPERLESLGVDAESVVNPATGQPGAITSIEAKEKLENSGLTTWTDAGFFILVLAASVREHAAMFVDANETERMLESVQNIHPRLTEAACESMPVDTLTAVLRTLVADGISVQRFPQILEWIVEAESGGGVPRAVEAIRQYLFRATTNRISHGTNTVVCHLVSSEIELQLTEASALWDPSLPPAGGVVRAFLEAYQTELSFIPPTAQRPIVLTSDDARAAVASTLRSAFPRTGVFSYSDLDPQANVQPVARIQLAE